MGNLGVTAVGSYSHVPGFAGMENVIKSSTSETVVSGEGVVVEFTVMGRITASRKLAVLDKDAVDGSAVPVGVMATDTLDATSGDYVGAALYLKGEFNENRLIFAAGTAYADVQDEMIAANLYISKALPETGIY